MVTAKIKIMLLRSDHEFWVLIQQVAVRGLLALKFLLAARLLGPEQIALVGIATLSLAIVESLSDTGLSQAVVQRHSQISPNEAGAAWTLQMSRGLVLTITLLLLSEPIAVLFKATASANLVALAAVIPLFRNAFNPGVFMVQRDRNFRRLSIYEASAALLDFATTLVLIYIGFGSTSILVGNIASDCVKLVLSWTLFRIHIKPTFDWQLIRDLTSFGKWVWSSSVITLVLNQIDKVLVARFLGTTEFGLYQVASRIAQLVVADGANALGQYLFPTFAKRHRSSPQAALDYLSWIMWRLVPGAATVALLLIVMAGILVNTVLSPEWSGSVIILRVLAVPMFLGAVIVVLVAYLRGTGRPKVITHAILIQLMLLLISAPPLLYYFGAIGMASSLAVAGSVSFAYMFHNIYIHR